MERSPDQPSGRTPAEKRQLARLVAFGVVVMVILAFVLANRHEVKVSFVLVDRRVPLVWALVLTAVLGALADRLWRWQRARQR